MTQPNDLPSPDVVRAVLNVVAPGYTSFTVHPLEASYSNHTHRVQVEFANRAPEQIVLRRYNEQNGDCAGKARREFKTLEFLQRHSVPIPEPLRLDDNGALMGSPEIVTKFVAGSPILASPESPEWASKAEQVARMLARIHATPYEESAKEFLMNANREAAWFLKGDAVPAYMRAHPDGDMIWHTLHDALPRMQPVEPRLIHLDFWSGNLLWDNGQISAVLDWEEASYGDPAVDVAYCLMEFVLEGKDEAADTFLRVYEQEAEQPIANLGIWALAAAVRPMNDLEDWLSRPPMPERFRRFIARAKQRIT